MPACRQHRNPPFAGWAFSLPGSDRKPTLETLARLFSDAVMPALPDPGVAQAVARRASAAAMQAPSEVRQKCDVIEVLQYARRGDARSHHRRRGPDGEPSGEG